MPQRRYRTASVVAAQIAAVAIHFILVKHSNNWFVDLLCHIPSIIFILTCTMFIRVCDVVPSDYLIVREPRTQFILQFFPNFMVLNLCMHGIWTNVENFVHLLLPGIIDETLTLSPDGKWYGVLEIPVRVWTTVVAALVAYFCLTIVSPIIHRRERRLGMSQFGLGCETD